MQKTKYDTMSKKNSIVYNQGNKFGSMWIKFEGFVASSISFHDFGSVPE